MPELETIADVVAAGVEAQAIITKHLGKADAAAARLVEVTKRGVELGMVQGLLAKRIIAQANAACGTIGAAELAFADLHMAQTDICKAADADLGDVTDAFGTTIGGVHTEGGGRK